jgi:MFS family permease
MVLWSSQVVSTVGTRVTSIAFPLLVLALTHSPAEAGVVGFAQTLPFLLLYLPAGAFIDRWDRKRTMLACDAGRAVALGGIAVTLALGWLSMAQVVVVALIDGSLFVLFDLAEGAALPQLVTEEQLPAAIAQNQAKTQGADVAGQPLGGVLFSTAPAAALPGRRGELSDLVCRATVHPPVVPAAPRRAAHPAEDRGRRRPGLGVAPAVPARCAACGRPASRRPGRTHANLSWNCSRCCRNGRSGLR